MEFKQIQELIKLVNKSELNEVVVEQDGFKIKIRSKDYSKGAPMMAPVAAAPMVAPAPIAAAPAAAPAPAAASNGEASAPAPAAEESTQDGVEFKSPMIGTFYRRPSPDKDAFVKVGDKVKTGDVLCIIEAMKLFNEIEFEGEGTVLKVLADDQSPIEYDQPLFLIGPA